MFREQQISILKWYLKDHVTLTNITFELYCMQMYVLANHFAFGINFHKCFGIKSLVCLHIILFLQWKAQTDVFLQTEFRFYWLQSKVEEVEGLSEITKINPVSEWNLWTKLNFVVVERWSVWFMVCSLSLCSSGLWVWTTSAVQQNPSRRLLHTSTTLQ